LSKKPKYKEKVSSAKKPKTYPANLPEQALQKKPVWRFGRLDFQEKWGFNQLNEFPTIEDIHSKLKNFETMTWREIEGKNNHYIDVKDICKEAQERLRQIKLDEYDTLFSFRLTGKKRLWGIRENEILYLLWWDPEHTVYPIEKSHT